jgi:hypothetical protein
MLFLGIGAVLSQSGRRKNRTPSIGHPALAQIRAVTTVVASFSLSIETEEPVRPGGHVIAAKTPDSENLLDGPEQAVVAVWLDAGTPDIE